MPDCEARLNGILTFPDVNIGPTYRRQTNFDDRLAIFRGWNRLFFESEAAWGMKHIRFHEPRRDGQVLALHNFELHGVSFIDTVCKSWASEFLRIAMNDAS
jgi:hypothetical protein